MTVNLLTLNSSKTEFLNYTAEIMSIHTRRPIDHRSSVSWNRCC